MNKKLFGTDGVRGLANHYPMTPEVALALGRAAGKIFRRQLGASKVVIGKDTRLSCYVFEAALVAGFCSMGVDTMVVGPFPTPGIAFLTKAYRAAAGVVISASHNPYTDNGIKFFSADGYKLPESLETQIEQLVAANDFGSDLPSGYEMGRSSRLVDAHGRYVEFVKASFPRSLTLKGIRIALDCANGATYKIAPLVFQELDAHVDIFGNAPNGININENCGALHPHVVQKAVIEHAADVGIAIDGDGDRLIMVDEKAQIVDGDTLLGICALDYKRRGLLKGDTVVGTVMSNFGFIKTMEDNGIRTVLSKVGDKHVLEAMLKEEALMGGEQSGHLLFLEHNTTGDALIAALQVLRIMIETESTLSQLAAQIKRYPQVLINVAVRDKPEISTLAGVNAAIKTAEEALGTSGRVLVRYSGTENICRVMVEGPKHKQVSLLAQSLADTVKVHIGV